MHLELAAVTVADGLSEKSIVSFDGNAVPFGIMELAAGISVTGRESPSLTLVPGSSIQNDNPNAMLVGYDIANHQATPTIRL